MDKYELNDSQKKYIDSLETETIRAVDYYLDMMENPEKLKHTMIPIKIMEEIIPISSYIMEYLESKHIYAQFIDPKDMQQYCDPNYYIDSYYNEIPCHMQLFDKTKEVFSYEMSSINKDELLDVDSDSDLY
jgi:hypothetical protein